MFEETFVKMPVVVTKNPGRGQGFAATYGSYPAQISAEGPTVAEAKDKLTAKLAVALETITSVKPAFALDDNDSVWAAVPAPDGGSDWYRVAGTQVRRNASSSKPASEAFKTNVGMTVLPVS